MKNLLIELNACEEAYDWAAKLNFDWQRVYKECDRGDWLLWLFARTNRDDLRQLTLAKGKCAELVKHHMKDERSIKAVETAIAFGEGKATREELKDVAADATCYASAADAASYFAADVAYDYAADDVASAAVYADAATIEETLGKCADICREYLPINIWNV